MRLSRCGLGVLLVLALAVGVVAVLAQPAAGGQDAAPSAAELVPQAISLLVCGLALLGAAWCVRYHEGRTSR